MNDKQSKYVNNVIALLTKQRNDALDLNTKLQADLITAQMELAELKKEEEKEEEKEKEKIN
tara:strand:+ start:811 stop:993 length:183 start_codon:yes stop_codon:yes gene_type:complete